MRRILVTGANRGIGLAIATRIVEEHDDTHVLVTGPELEGARAAVAAIETGVPAAAGRLEALELDVTSDASVSAAAARVAEMFGPQPAPLYAVVNNAGVRPDPSEIRAAVEVNTRGLRRVCEAFAPLIDRGAGRIVNVTSSAGPSFVEACSPERQRFFIDPEVRWPDVDALIEEAIALAEGGGDAAAFAAIGLGDGNAYGFSKACANSYHLQLTRENPDLLVSACTPGWVDTEMTRPYAESQGKSPAELGMITPAQGASTPMFLLFGDLEASGWFYGSDAKRSPMHRYRDPGSPPYAGD